jgi:metal-responsive CopG/Arc/MetJ family transcriptional regulator
MKIAISIPDALFQEAEDLVERWQVSRSELYSRAIAEFVGRHTPDRVQEALERALEGIDQAEDAAFLRQAARRVIERDDW